MPKTVTMHRAKTELSKLVKAIQTGEECEIIIAVGKKPAARLVPIGPPATRPLGMFEGLFEVPDDFDDPDPELEALFYDGPVFPE